MIGIKIFVFNTFQVNTYILHDETKECIIIDPGCVDEYEKSELINYISVNGLNPVKIINTHIHVDHILGNAFVCKHYEMGWETHPSSRLLWELAGDFSKALNIKLEKIGNPSATFEEGDLISFGNSALSVLYTPGHADGSCCFVNDRQKFVIAGDVLFRDSIGRTDLPTGDYNLLKESIVTKLFTLGEEYTVYPGHGPETTIGHEIAYNPFLGV